MIGRATRGEQGLCQMKQLLAVGAVRQAAVGTRLAVGRTAAQQGQAKGSRGFHNTPNTTHLGPGLHRRAWLGSAWVATGRAVGGSRGGARNSTTRSKGKELSPKGGGEAASNAAVAVLAVPPAATRVVRP